MDAPLRSDGRTSVDSAWRRSRAYPSLKRALVIVVLAATARCLFAGTSEVELTLRMQSWAGTDGELFYGATDEPFSHRRRAAFTVVADGIAHDYTVKLPAGDWRRLRIDPGSAPGEVRLRGLSAKVGRRKTKLDKRGLLEALGPLQQVHRLGTGIANGVGFEAEPGGDPGIELNLPDGFIQPPAWRLAARMARTGLGAGLGYLLLDLMVLGIVGRVRATQSFQRLLRVVDKAAAALSDDGVLVLGRPHVAMLLVMAAFTVVYLALSLNQSSMEIWERRFPARDVEQLIELGTPRDLRSDEWAVGSPWILGQVARGEPLQNPSVGGEEAPLVAGIPVAHWSNLASIEYYGFALLGVERGFSWLWAFHTLGLFFSFTWLLLILTKGNLGASLLASSWVFISPFTQWWLSSVLPATMISFAMAVVGVTYWLNAKRVGWIWVGTLIAVYFLVKLVMHPYPPFAVPLAYLAVAILGGSLVESWPRRAELGRRKQRIIALILGTVVLGVFVLGFIREASETMNIMMNTVYPGKRRVLLGALSPLRVFYGFFDWLRFDEYTLPLPPTNACEASNFLLLWPIVPFIIRPLAFLERGQGLVAGLLAYVLFLTCWSVGWLPEPIAQLSSKLGWAFTTNLRAFVGLGVGSIVLLAVTFARVQRQEVAVLSADARKVLLLGVVLSVTQLGFALRLLDPEFFRPQLVFAGALVAVLLAAGTAFGRLEPWVVAVGLLAVPGLNVNPLLSGVSSLLEKPLFVKAKQVGGRPEDRWVVFSYDFTLSQGLKAQGLDVITGSQLLPNFKVVNALDPTHKFEEVWNRFANVVFLPAASDSAPNYRFVQLDFYIVDVPVCGPQLRALGINRVAFEGYLADPFASCLKPLPSVDDSGVKFYELTDSR